MKEKNNATWNFEVRLPRDLRKMARIMMAEEELDSLSQLVAVLIFEEFQRGQEQRQKEAEK